MRVFVAVLVPGHTALESAHTALGGMGASVKAVRPDNMHLTLKFIGDTSVTVGDLLTALEAATEGHSPFVLRPESAGAFPNWDRPNVIWIGFGDGDIAASLASSLDQVLSEHFSFEPDRRSFSAHLTLARIKGHARTAELRRLADAALGSLSSEGYSIPVSSVHLMSSTLNPKGPIYEQLGIVPLRG